MRLAGLASCCIGLLISCGPSPTATSALNGRGGPEGQSGAFPTGPNESVTPGKVCQHPDTYRYPEHIAYCERNVDSSTKKDIIHDYDQEFGYQIEAMNRMDFKIDHYISLCMGGSNDVENLWPQHKSVYVLTDGIEAKLCELMSMGKLHQNEAIEKIKHVKNHLDEAPALERELTAEIGH